ncbi:hypothetical protein NDN08_004110 [Rhodosorus marinus]|uniref:Uncharacterized protein n=1 Tax=Rhodosorus marinus TaxID=101924 RepID=A0AAV8UKB3_9RHOD|nr:hypothetical protein NDN08_004110 [Rhodosorus marinus]
MVAFVSSGAVSRGLYEARRVCNGRSRVRISCSASPSSHSDIKRFVEGPKFNQVNVHNGMVYLSGQVAADTSDATVLGQSKQIFGAIDELLAIAGTDKSRVLSVSTWLTDMGEFADFNSAWDDWVDMENKPTRACVESKLAKPEFLVEVAVTAALPSKAGIISTDKAAAAVGPYNQAIRLADGMVFVSGCIGLKPGSGEMAGDTLEVQTAQALSNMREILAAAGAAPSDVVKTMILLEDISDFAEVNSMYKDFFGEGRVPARSTFAVKSLPKGAKVEIECMAVAP